MRLLNEGFASLRQKCLRPRSPSLSAAPRSFPLQERVSLSYSIAQMGWIGGLLTLLAFAAITWYTTFLLSEACIVNGVRQRTYMSELELHERF